MKFRKQDLKYRRTTYEVVLAKCEILFLWESSGHFRIGLAALEILRNSFAKWTLGQHKEASSGHK